MSKRRLWQGGPDETIIDTAELVELRQQLAEVTAQRDALAEEMQYVISELNSDPTVRDLASLSDSMSIVLARIFDTESPAGERKDP